MKRPVSLVASLVLIAGLATGCSQAPTKDEVSQACMKRMGGVQTKCDCYVASLEKALPADAFAKVAKGAFDNRDYGGADWLPTNIRADPAISEALHSATATCLTQS